MRFSPHNFQCQHLLGSSVSQMTERDKSETLIISPSSAMKTSFMGKATLYLKFPVIVMQEHIQHVPDLTRAFQFLQTLGDVVFAGILLLCTSFKVQLSANHSIYGSKLFYLLPWSVPVFRAFVTINKTSYFQNLLSQNSNIKW